MNKCTKRTFLVRRIRDDKVFFREEVHDDLVTKDKMYPDLFLHYIMLFNVWTLIPGPLLQ